MARLIEIRDPKAPELEVYADLTHAQLRRRKEGELFIAESGKVIGHALEAGCRPVSFLMEERQVEGFLQLLAGRWADVPIYTARREVLAELTGYALTRGMLAAMVRPALPCFSFSVRGPFKA